MHLVTSSGVQLVVINDDTHYFSMTFLSCPVEHCISFGVSAMEERFNSRDQVVDGTDMATPCC